MSEGFELVGTITMRTDDKGYLDIEPTLIKLVTVQHLRIVTSILK
jgi:hypothetical protein